MEGVKDLKDKLENSWLFRKNILNMSKRRFNKKKARNMNVEYERFQLNFLKYWHSLEEVPEVKLELEGLSDEEKKDKKEELKCLFCENILSSKEFEQGYKYAESKKEMFKSKIPKKFRK